MSNGLKNDVEEAKISPWTKYVASSIILLCITEFGVGLAAFSFFKNSSEDRHGGWWAVFAPTIIAICGLVSTHRTVLLTSCIIGIGGLIILTAALIIDVIGYWRFSLITGCVNTSNDKISGSVDCGANFDDATTAPQCVCSSEINDIHCYSFDLTSGNDCSAIMTTYPHELIVSIVLLALIAMLTVTYLFPTCGVACIPDAVRNAQQYTTANASDVYHDGHNDSSTKNPCPRMSEGIEMASLPPSLQSLSTSEKQRRAVSIGGFEEDEQNEEEEEEEIVFDVRSAENTV